MNKNRGVVVGLALSLLAHAALADPLEQAVDDPHYTAAGFFDLHVCNWPQRGQFILAVFSTEQFDQIKSVDVYTPDHGKIAGMAFSNFREFKTKAGKLKRAFIDYLEIPAKHRDGWYRARIALKDGSIQEAGDYLVKQIIDYPSDLYPAPDSYDMAMPKAFSWSKVNGAKYYKVTIRDKLDNRVVYASDLIEQNQIAIPPGVLEPGKLYGWKVHARDGKESILLGDFNHGSLSQEAVFSIN